MNDRFMELGEALEKVHTLAASYLANHKQGMNKELLDDFLLALDTVHDFIVNNFEAEENE